MKIDKTVERELKLESARVREIVKEIVDFGVNDYQIKKIIKFLSLELENRALMVGISSLIDKNLEDKNQKQQKIKIET